jgi:DnaJ domain
MRLKFSQRNQVGRATGAAKKTLYDFLGVDPGADAQTVKRAFRKTVKEHHPDLHRDDPAANQQTKVLIAAHELLSDPQQRAAYDQYLAQLHEPPLRSEWQRRIINGASTAVYLSFALVSAWEVSVASTHQLTPAMQGRPYVETAGRGIYRETTASTGKRGPRPRPLLAQPLWSRIRFQSAITIAGLRKATISTGLSPISIGPFNASPLTLRPIAIGPTPGPAKVTWIGRWPIMSRQSGSIQMMPRSSMTAA